MPHERFSSREPQGVSPGSEPIKRDTIPQLPKDNQTTRTPEAKLTNCPDKASVLGTVRGPQGCNISFTNLYGFYFATLISRRALAPVGLRVGVWNRGERPAANLKIDEPFIQTGASRRKT